MDFFNRIMRSIKVGDRVYLWLGIKTKKGQYRKKQLVDGKITRIFRGHDSDKKFRGMIMRGIVLASDEVRKSFLKDPKNLVPIKRPAIEITYSSGSLSGKEWFWEGNIHNIEIGIDGSMAIYGIQWSKKALKRKILFCQYP